MTNDKNIPPRYRGLAVMLEQIGLTLNDSLVYLHLLEYGLALSGSKLATILKLHRQYVYNSIEKLQRLILIEAVNDGHRLKYKALPPTQVTKLVRKKLDDAEILEMELRNISTVGAEQDFEVYLGERQIYDFEERVVETLNPDTEQFIIGGASDHFIKFFGDQYKQFSGIAKDQKLRSKYVGCPEEEEWLKLAKASNPHFEYVILRTLPKTVVNTAVRFDTVTMYSFANPPLVYVIKSKVVADDYKKFFFMLWDMGSNN